MIRRTLCVFLLLATPAAALDVYEDTLIGLDTVPPGETIQVFGDATLTIDGALNVRRVTLNDTSSIIFNSGTIRGGVDFKGDNAFTMNGGAVKDNRFRAIGPGHTTITLLGGDFEPGIQSWNASATQNIYANMDLITGLPEFIAIMNDELGAGTKVTYASKKPHYTWSQGAFRIGGEGYQTGDLSALPGITWPPTESKIEWELISNVPTVAGDVDRNGVVDLEDLNAVRNRFGQFYPDEMLGDANLDGKVDLDDLNAVRNNFGASTAVPEPSSFATMAIGAVAWLAWRRRGRRM
jgi:hypothetical protein